MCMLFALCVVFLVPCMSNDLFYNQTNSSLVKGAVDPMCPLDHRICDTGCCKCPDGFVENDWETQCVRCGGGTYENSVSSPGICLNCPSGYSLPDANQCAATNQCNRGYYCFWYVQYPIPLGSYTVELKPTSASQCEPGYYSNVPYQWFPLQFNLKVGKSFTDLVTFKGRYFFDLPVYESNTALLWYWSADTAWNYGSLENYGTDVYSYQFYSPILNYLDAMTGTFVPFPEWYNSIVQLRNKFTGFNCIACPIDYYGMDKVYGATACIACAQGTFTYGIGATSCFGSCPLGQYYMYESNTCNECKSGTYLVGNSTYFPQRVYVNAQWFTFSSEYFNKIPVYAQESSTTQSYLYFSGTTWHVGGMNPITAPTFSLPESPASGYPISMELEAVLRLQMSVEDLQWCLSCLASCPPEQTEFSPCTKTSNRVCCSR